MILPHFYDRLLAASPSLAEGEMRARLTEALETISSEAGVPRLRLFVPVVQTGGLAAVPLPVRHVLTPSAGAGHLVRVDVLEHTDEEATTYQLRARDAAGSFEVDVECYPPAVPAEATSPEGRAFEVPFGDVALNYILSELYGGLDPNMARLHYSRYEQGKLRLKRDARRGADHGTGIVVQPDPFDLIGVVRPVRPDDTGADDVVIDGGVLPS